MTRFWPEGDPIEVVAGDGGRPLHFTWREEEHQVEEITRNWRVDTGWWAQHTWRAYFKLVTDTGLLMIIYEDLANGGWYVERMYD